MKKTLSFTAILLMLAGVISCKKGTNDKICDCNNKTNPVEIVDMEGVIHFNEDIQEWYISVYEQNTYDVMQLFLPCNINDAYKKVNKKILFSGTVFDLSIKINAPAESDYACIEISSISNLP
jgi:hypothetical protein